MFRHSPVCPSNLTFQGSGFIICTWTPQVCRIMAFYGFWAVVLPTFGVGKAQCTGGPFVVRDTKAPEPQREAIKAESDVGRSVQSTLGLMVWV